MSSTMRNAVARRPHRERAQPLERKKLGLLEKKKDYTLRAQDFNKKKKQLKNLRAKAAERNEDEFYFGMLSRKGPGSKLSRGKSFTGTVDGDRGNKVLDMDTARLLKTQDIAYVRSVRTHMAKEVLRLQQGLVMAKGIAEVSDGGRAKAGVAKKIVFADDDAERAEMMGDLEEEEEDDADDFDEEMMANFDPMNMDTFDDFSDDYEESDDAESEAEAKATEPTKRKTTKELEAENKKKSEKEIAQQRAEKRVGKMENRLKDLEKKLRSIARAEQLMSEQQAKMGKTATSGGVTKKGKKIVVRTRKR